MHMRFLRFLAPMLILVSQRAMVMPGRKDYPGYPYTIMAPEHGAIRHHRAEAVEANARALAQEMPRAPPIAGIARRNIAVARGSSGLGAAGAAAAHAAHSAGGRRRRDSSRRAAGAGSDYRARASPIRFRICRTAPRPFRTAPRAVPFSRASTACPAPPARNTWAPVCSSSRPAAHRALRPFYLP